MCSEPTDLSPSFPSSRGGVSFSNPGIEEDLHAHLLFPDTGVLLGTPFLHLLH